MYGPFLYGLLRGTLLPCGRATAGQGASGGHVGRSSRTSIGRGRISVRQGYRQSGRSVDREYHMDTGSAGVGWKDELAWGHRHPSVLPPQMAILRPQCRHKTQLLGWYLVAVCAVATLLCSATEAAPLSLGQAARTASQSPRQAAEIATQSANATQPAWSRKGEQGRVRANSAFPGLLRDTLTSGFLPDSGNQGAFHVARHRGRRSAANCTPLDLD